MSEQEQFRVGDVVQLKSGGPKMTVTDVGNDMGGTLSAWVKWFEGTKAQSEVFPVGALKKADG
jgi:uncharacterized protein YodC (DUF2158 family)